MKLYPFKKGESGHEDGGFTEEEVKSGAMWLRCDVKCSECGLEQSAGVAGGIDGRCVRCGGKVY